MTPEEAPRFYSQWTGNPRGFKERTTDCIVEVYGSKDYIGHQCRKPRGHGPNGLYCRQHAKNYEARS